MGSYAFGCYWTAKKGFLFSHFFSLQKIEFFDSLLSHPQLFILLPNAFYFI